jgi:hypothetical protein
VRKAQEQPDLRMVRLRYLRQQASYLEQAAPSARRLEPL